jgi:3-mercaptopyruvate sulfurtransferase SseA
MATRTNEVLVGTEEVAARLGEEGLRILEVDEDTEADGRGHLPGARNIPWVKAVDPETGAFLPTERLRSLYEGQG